MQTVIEIKKNGRVVQDGQAVPARLRPTKDGLIFEYKILDEPGVNYDLVQATLILPQGVSVESIKATPYVTHSYHADLVLRQVEPGQLVLRSGQLGPQAILSLRIELPNEAVTVPLYRRVGYLITSQSLSFWLVISLAGPLIGLIYLTLILVRQNRSRKKSATHLLETAPPFDSPPALVGVLKRGKLGSRDITATLMDLARRGYLEILVKNETQFNLIKTAKLEAVLPAILANPGQAQNTGLNDFEQFMIAKLFVQSGWGASAQDVFFRAGHRIFSGKMAGVFLKIYQKATATGWFIENPARLHQRWRNRGLVLFYLGFFGLLVGLFFGPEPKVYLLFWVSAMALALVVMALAPGLPIETRHGQESLRRWQAFENYLASLKPASGLEAVKGLFVEYLPLAIALGVERQWARRFAKVPFTLPEWFSAGEPVRSLEEFDRRVLGLTSWISDQLISAKDPVVD